MLISVKVCLKLIEIKLTLSEGTNEVSFKCVIFKIQDF